MTNITRFNPFGELARFDPFGEDFARAFALRPMFGQLESQPQMRIDVTEDEKAYTIKAEIPGAGKEDIKVSIDGNLVSISAEVKKEKEEKRGETVIRRERYQGSVSRSFTLPQAVNEDKAQAKYENGVLVLTLQKKPGANAKQLTVS